MGALRATSGCALVLCVLFHCSVMHAACSCGKAARTLPYTRQFDSQLDERRSKNARSEEFELPWAMALWAGPQQSAISSYFTRRPPMGVSRLSWNWQNMHETLFLDTFGDHASPPRVLRDQAIATGVGEQMACVLARHSATKQCIRVTIVTGRRISSTYRS
ncbi:hypothetical protein BC835DRAFT_1400338 [Cytidiella melzeri]|nr:hypothetical protein BC835DRAFT_1400338 [Cytidiella melzeri]